MRTILEIYLIDDLLYSIKRSQSSKTGEHRYTIKSHYFGAMWLLIHSHKGGFKRETLEIYQDYFMKISENFSSITKQSNHQNVRNLVRTWIYLITREHSQDNHLLSLLENANSVDGWYRLSRCPLVEWSKPLKKVEIFSYELPMVTNTRKNIFKLLSKQNEWVPNFSFMATLEQFISLDEIVFSKYIKKQSQKEDN